MKLFYCFTFLPEISRYVTNYKTGVIYYVMRECHIVCLVFSGGSLLPRSKRHHPWQELTLAEAYAM